MKVLVIITTKLVSYGGIASAFMNYYRNMDLSGLSIDIVSCQEHDKELALEIEENGGRVFDVTTKQKNPLKYYLEIADIMRCGYDVVDVHGNSATMVGEMIIAKYYGIPNRMSHCLNSKTNHPIVHKIMSGYFNKLCNNRTACTEEAGRFLYGKNSYVVLRNSIPLDKYRYSIQNRISIRKKYNISDNTILVGTIGKINKQKNQLFFLSVLRELVKINENIKFLLVGDGPLREEVEKYIEDNNLQGYVILAGMQSDVTAYYSAFDIYVFPSLFEGESLALLEAKCSGVIGCASSQIKTGDDDGSRNIEYVDLDEEGWIKHMEKYIDLLSTINRDILSEEAISKIRAKGLDSVDCASQLKKLYTKNYGVS